nr:DUF5053 domain-containing protein [Bacteroides salyersiae]
MKTNSRTGSVNKRHTRQNERDSRKIKRAIIERAEETILRDKLGELPEAISFSYIARKYFGKNRHWLYQRINGNIVNGKKARLTDNELKTFLNALNDVSEMIHQTSLKLS